MNEEEKASELPDMAIAHMIHRYGAEFCTDKEDVKKQLLEHIEKNSTFRLRCCNGVISMTLAAS
jgi:hypothetical protein